jgi:hypothetical protein
MASVALPTADAPLHSTGEWDEGRYQAALSQLEQLQQQLDDLRLTIPRIVAPLSTHHTRSTAFYVHFKQAAVGATVGLKAFRSRWQSQEIQSIFERARRSFTSDADLGPSAQVPKYGWAQSVSSRRGLVNQNTKEGTAGIDESHTSTSAEDVSRIVTEFTQAQPGIAARTDNDGHRIQMSVDMGHITLKFRVVIVKDANARSQLHVECLGSVKLSAAITRCISSRPHANDLRYLLDMIAAYKSEGLVSCAKCARQLDSSGLVPAARRSKKVTNPSGNPMTVWEPFHEQCMIIT